MQCRQLADIALNAPAIERVFYCLNWDSLARTRVLIQLTPLVEVKNHRIPSRARTDPKIPINLQYLGILNFRLPRFFGSVFAPAIERGFLLLIALLTGGQM